MGQKQPPVDQSTDPKKRRRVGFFSVDAGAEAKNCIKIFLVSNKEEVGASDSFCIDPVDLEQFFDDDGKIYGYQGLKITIWINTISFQAFADITYHSTCDGGKGITDLKSALQRMFGETLVEKKDDFLQTFSSERDYIKSIISSGEVLQHKPSIGQNNGSNGHTEAQASNLEAVRMAVGNMPAGHLYSRLVPLVLLLVDGSSPIDITDPNWELYFVIEKKIDEQGDSPYKLLGFAAAYRFFHYPDTSRLRLSQILVLPPYQNKGYGRYLLDLLHNIAISENVYDFAVEEPLDYFQHVRTCVDTLRLLTLESVQKAVNSVVSHLKHTKLSKKTQTEAFLPPRSAVEDVRKILKINKKQFVRCWEVLIYLGLDPVDKYMENFVMFISDRLKVDILGKDSGCGGKKVIDVPSDYDDEKSFVMFKSGGDVEGGSVLVMDETLNNQEEQLKQLVDERVEDVKLIAEKVSLHRS